MLYINQIKKIVKELELPSDKYWVSSGAGLVLHGVKEATQDVDLGCTQDLWNDLLEQGYMPEAYNSDIIKINDFVEIVKDWFVDDFECLDGIPVASLESIKKQKLALGRDKDFRDIKLIDNYIMKNSPAK